MKTLRRCPDLSLFTIITFLTFMTFGGGLTSCGGSSSSESSDSSDNGGDSGGGGTTTTPSFESFQSTTTGTDGKATFTSTKLSGVNSVETTLTLPNGEAASGMTVYYSESDDGHFMIVSRDTNGTYQSIFITSDIDTVAANSSAGLSALLLESGDTIPALLERDGKELTIAALILVAGAALAFTTGALTLQNKINKVSGKIDPVRLVKSGSDCFSINTLLEHLDIATSAVGLVFWTASTLSSAGTTLTMDGLYEILLENIADNIKDEVEQLFWDEVLNGAFAGLGVNADSNICWILRTPSMDYYKILEVRPDVTCTTSADCDSLTAVAQTFTVLDGDQDGYTPAASDCNDQDANIYPGASEVCDSGIDSNCDGQTTTCNVTTNLYVDGYPTGGSLSSGGSGDVSLVMMQGSFLGTGSDTLSQVHILINDSPEQIKDTTNYGGGQFGFWDLYTVLRPGLNNIQVYGQGGTHYGANSFTFTNTNATPSLTLMLSWDACPNLDLYVVEPDTGVIYSGNTTGNYGSMTYTTTGGWGPEVYKALNPASGQRYYYYVKHAGNGSCGASGYSADYTIRAFTPYGTTMKSGTIAEGATGSMYEVSF